MRRQKFIFAALAAVAAGFAEGATSVTHREATNIAEAVAAEATNGLVRTDGAARPLPKYLHHLTLDDTYPEDAAWYYEQADSAVTGGCSARRRGALVERNYDWSYDESATFVLSVGSSSDRFASLGVASAGMHLTEDFVTSGKWSRYYKVLPGRTLDGINENGVVCEINVVPTNGSPWETRTEGRDLNAIGAVRWALDHGTDAPQVVDALRLRVYIPESMKRLGYSAHFLVADKNATWIVEDGEGRVLEEGGALTNYRLYAKDDPYGTGYERAKVLSDPAVSITSAWFRAAYLRPFVRPTEFAAPGVGTHDETEKLLAWAEANVPAGAPESLKRNGGSWQTVHTSVYDIGAKTLRVAVQETDDWYVFALPQQGGVTDAYTKYEALGVNSDGQVIVHAGSPWADDPITFDIPVRFGTDYTPHFQRGLSVGGWSYIGNAFVHGATLVYLPEKYGTVALDCDISADNPAFCEAVRAVEIPVDGTTTTLGALLAALAAAVAWLKRKTADLERRLDGLQPGFYVNGEEDPCPTLAEAIAHAATKSGDVEIATYADFTMDGTENWAALGGRKVVLKGLKGDRATVLTHTGAATGGFFANRANGLKPVVSNVTVVAASGTRVWDMELVEVNWIGSICGASPKSADYGFIRMTDVDVDADGGKYALDVVQGSRAGDTFTRCTFRNFSRSAVGFVYHSGNVVFEGCTFDGSSIGRDDTVGLVNFQGGTLLGHPVFRGCTFRGLRRRVGHALLNGPAIADRIPDDHDIDTLTVEDCTIEDTVAYLIGFGDAAGESTHVHFMLEGDGNRWTDWDGTKQSGTKMTPLGDGRYTGVGYLGDAPGDGNPVVETPWEGAGGTPGQYGSVGRNV